MKYSIVIPVLNEASRIEACLENVGSSIPNSEIIVVDGGSHDGTLDLLKRADVKLIHSNPSRGGQCRIGAENAQGEVLIFLHVDSVLNKGTKALLDRHFYNPQLPVATFSILFDGRQTKYRFFEWFAKFETLFSTYGDQGIIVRRDFYENHVAMPDMKLFEDVEFFRQARRKTNIVKLDIPIVSSVRRFERKGFWRMNVLNSLLMLGYACGVDEKHLHRIYYKR